MDETRTTLMGEIERLEGVKSDIREAIIAKGVELGEDARFDTFPAAIEQITGGSDTATDTPALAEDVREGKEFFANGESFFGTMPDAEVERIREPGSTGERLKITPGYLAEEINVEVGGGLDITDATATAADLLKGKTAYGYIPDEFRYGKIEGTLEITEPDEPAEQFAVAKVTQYTPYRAAFSVPTRLSVSGINYSDFVEEGEDVPYADANGEYQITPETENLPANERVYKHMEQNYWIKRFVDEWDEYGGDGWMFCTSMDDSYGFLVKGDSSDLPLGTGDWYDGEWGEIPVTIHVNGNYVQNYPEQPLVIAGQNATSYNSETGEWTFNESTVNFAGFEETPEAGQIFAHFSNKLIGRYITYDPAELKELAPFYASFSSPQGLYFESGQNITDSSPFSSEIGNKDGIPCYGIRYYTDNHAWIEAEIGKEIPRDNFTIIWSFYVESGNINCSFGLKHPDNENLHGMSFWGDKIKYGRDCGEREWFFEGMGNHKFDEWHHVAMVCRNKNLELWYAGSKVDEIPADEREGWGRDFDKVAHTNNDNAKCWNADSYVFDRALTEKEIRYIHNQWQKKRGGEE